MAQRRLVYEDQKEFVLRQVVDTWVVLPLDEQTVDFKGMLTLNDAGAMLWKLLEQGTDRKHLVEALTNAYDVDASQAADDVDAFVDKLRQAGCIND